MESPEAQSSDKYLKGQMYIALLQLKKILLGLLAGNFHMP